MGWGKDPLLLPYTYTSSSSFWSLLPHLQYYQICKSMIFKRWGKLNLENNQVIVTYWLKKEIRKLTLLKYSFSWNRTVTVNLMKLSSNNNFRWYNFGKFYIVKFNYFSGKPNKVKEMFWNIFYWPLCWWYWK